MAGTDATSSLAPPSSNGNDRVGAGAGAVAGPSTSPSPSRRPHQHLPPSSSSSGPSSMRKQPSFQVNGGMRGDESSSGVGGGPPSPYGAPTGYQQYYQPPTTDGSSSTNYYQNPYASMQQQHHQSLHPNPYLSSPQHTYLQHHPSQAQAAAAAEAYYRQHLYQQHPHSQHHQQQQQSRMMNPYANPYAPAAAAGGGNGGGYGSYPAGGPSNGSGAYYPYSATAVNANASNGAPPTSSLTTASSSASTSLAAPTTNGHSGAAAAGPSRYGGGGSGGGSSASSSGTAQGDNQIMTPAAAASTSTSSTPSSSVVPPTTTHSHAASSGSSPLPSPRYPSSPYTNAPPPPQPHFSSFVPGRYGHPAYLPQQQGSAQQQQYTAAPPSGARGGSYRGNGGGGAGSYPVAATAPTFRPQQQIAGPSYYGMTPTTAGFGQGSQHGGVVYPMYHPQQYQQSSANGQHPTTGSEFDSSSSANAARDDVPSAVDDVDPEQPVFASISRSDPDSAAYGFSSPPALPSILQPAPSSGVAFSAGDDDRPVAGGPPPFHLTIAHTPQTIAGASSPPAPPPSMMNPYSSPPAGFVSPHQIPQQFSVPPSIGAVLSPPMPSSATFASVNGAAPGSVSPTPSNAAIYASVMKAKTPVLEQRPELSDEREEREDASVPEAPTAVSRTVIDEDAPSGWSVSESPSASSFWLANRAPNASDAPAISIARTARPPRKTRKNAQKHHEPRQVDGTKEEPQAREQRERVGFTRAVLQSRASASEDIKLTFGEIDLEEYERLAATPVPERPVTPKPQESATAEPAGFGAASATPATPANVPRAPPRSWAALLRTGQTPSTSKGSPAPSATSAQVASNVATPGSSPKAAPTSAPNGSSESVSQAPSELGTPAQATSPVVSKSRPPPPAAWTVPGKFSNEEMSRLLLEGLPADNTTARARTATVPRGLINTGNMCFANSILQVLAYCGPFTALFEELGKRVQADLGRRTPLIEAMVLFLKEFAPVGADANAEAKGDLLPSAFPAVALAHVRNGSTSILGVKQEPFVPSYVYDAMRENKRFDNMRRGHQEDAEEFLGFFLETLHEEMLYLYSRHESRTFGRTPSAAQLPSQAAATTAASSTAGDEREVSRPVSPSAGGDGWLEVGKKQKVNIVRTTENKESSVSRIFGGKLRSVLHTPGQKDSVTLEPYQPLQLEISPNEVVSLEDALRYLNAPEIIPEVWSQSKNTHVDATKQVFIDTLPPILILHLKRFVYDVVEHRVVKRAKPVAYGQELEIPAEIISPARRSQVATKYKLFGVVYHHGSSATGGHYTACVQRHDPSAPSNANSPATGSWLHLDDETVEEVSVDEVVVSKDAAIKDHAGEVGRARREKCAYLAFYQRA